MMGESTTGIALLVGAASLSGTWVGRFEGAGRPPEPWTVIAVNGAPRTEYRIGSVAGRTALEAIVDRSMSMLARPVSVDLNRTPILCWQWYVDAPVEKADMTRTNRTDFAARIYVGFKMPASSLSLMTRVKLKVARSIYGGMLPDAALAYVWDNKHPVGTKRKSAYSDRIEFVVAESGKQVARRWTSERVDIARDFASAFANKPGEPTIVAIASDGDDTKSSGRAGYADIRFVAANETCGA